jgi:hypothetical protein
MCEERIPSLYNTSEKQVFDHGSNDKERQREGKGRRHTHQPFNRSAPDLIRSGKREEKRRERERRRKCGARAYNNFVNVSS